MPIYAPFHDCADNPPLYIPVRTYRHWGIRRWPPPEPKPVLRCYTFPDVHTYQANAVGVPNAHHGERESREKRGEPRDSKRRRVHFADRPVVIELPTYLPRRTSSAPAPSRIPPGPCFPSRTPAAASAPTPAPTPIAHPTPTARQTPPSAPAQSHHRRSVTATSGLHDLLVSFPSSLWDLRRNARPTYHPQYQPRYSELVFPHDRRKSSITLYFHPCDHTEFSWTAKVKAHHGKHLTVNGVLGAISTELFRRSACRDLCEGAHPCYANARSAHRIRTRRGHTQRPHYDDAFRNVDLYHADRGRGLYFEGLQPEMLGDGEVVYLVQLGCA
ncbi:hypothetical protein LXA43DRAFT_1162188 [Ganoderma leucocontextum]|nr:hypothetical protein LXA43DRAFT_1162188 [Ganoderma leucocontextum]